MKLLLRLILAVAALAAAGCTPRAEETLTVDGFLATEHPDSALRLLRRMDPARMSRARRAGWSLLTGLSEVATGDTLAGKVRLDRAMRYYERHGTEGERAEAWYTYAKAYIELGDLEEGIRGYTEAAILAEKALAEARSGEETPQRKQTETLLVAIYHTLGLLYFEQGYDAVKPFAKAVEAARANGNAEQEGYSRFMLASAHCAAGEYRQAVETLAPLVEAADTIPFRYFAQQIRLQNLVFHAYLGDWTPAQLLAAREGIDLDVIRRAPLSYGSAASEDTGRSFYDVASAIIFQQDGQLDSARHYIEMALSTAGRRSTREMSGCSTSRRRSTTIGATTPGPTTTCSNLSRPRTRSSRRSAGRRSPSSNAATARQTTWRCARRRCATAYGSPHWQPCWWSWRRDGPWSATAASCAAATAS